MAFTTWNCCFTLLACYRHVQLFNSCNLALHIFKPFLTLFTIWDRQRVGNILANSSEIFRDLKILLYALRTLHHKFLNTVHCQQKKIQGIILRQNWSIIWGMLRHWRILDIDKSLYSKEKVSPISSYFGCLKTQFSAVKYIWCIILTRSAYDFKKHCAIVVQMIPWLNVVHSISRCHHNNVQLKGFKK